jgi:hypothetical protein
MPQKNSCGSGGNMEQIKQLKTMRDEARTRIEATADYKLATSLDALITDLEKALGLDGDDSDAGDDEESAGHADAIAEPVQPAADVMSDTDYSSTSEISASQEDNSPVAEVNTRTTSMLGSGANAVDRIGDMAGEISSQDDSSQDDGDVMSELTRMISGQSESHTVNGATHYDDSANLSVSSQKGDEWSEEDAILKAMEALDEDLANTDLDSVPSKNRH